MKLSIIIPYDRYKNYLHDCLESISQQEITDYETLLVVNDESDVDEELKKYNINMKIIAAGAESNVAKKRNLGIKHAAGEYIYFIDCDDYLMPHTLSLLIKKAKQDDLDLVAGIRKFTWFKKKVFETMGDEKNDELNLKDKDHDRDDKFINKVYDESNITEYKTDILIRTRHALRNVSVLNILIKTELIKNHDILFNEKFLYYADAPFVVQLLNYATSFARVDDAVFVKRKHNDPINAPALSQIKDPDNKFNEFIEAHNYCTMLVEPDSYIRYYLDAKMVSYYTKFFAKKIRRGKDDIWRDERFKMMSEVLKNIRPELLNKSSRYSRKLINAAINNDIERAKKLVNMHLAKLKLKKIIKNKNEMNKYLYRYRYLKEPLEENMIMFETFMGKSYADSPKYIYEYLAKNYPGKYKFVWVLNDPKEKPPYGAIIVKRFTRKYAYYLAKSKYFVFNVRQPLWFRKREEQIFLETWHGTPLKRLAFDQEEVTAASPTYKAQFYRQKQEWDYLIAPNKFSSDIFKSCFMYDGKMLETGYPRNDLLSSPDREQTALKLKKKLGIPLDKKTILYAPTWRDDEYYGNGKYKFKLKLDLDLLKKELGNEYVVLLRTHHYIADALDVTGLEDFAFNLSKYDDITEIYLISDICITDYSSVFFDFANLKRPMLFYTYDLDKYRDVLRGFYIDMETELPGPLVYTTSEVVDKIKNLDKLNEQYQERYEQFYQRFCSWEDGKAAKRVVEEVFK
ncbi:MAG: bifunctional glycosyltransferase family 2 protein/CDP-glycerol:glycerophosphate glycerophosphotransferase [Thomasclavelia sp.]